VTFWCEFALSILFFFEETHAKTQREETFVTSLLLYYARVVPQLYIKYTYVYIHVLFYKYKNSAYFLQCVSINGDDDDDYDDDACVLFLST